ncbi:unnamed protein product [Rotaria magnacalcarata]|uniref:Uncharacterized protein n=1 Tax=Rotaria magnacalcarata TaxID=392030 RepID=A0A8S2QG02_9BILA|nr:unnamed protein product [Rotaria magnacalcarata]
MNNLQSMIFTYQFRLGCKAATIESTRREESMSESSNHIESSRLFNTTSNEHTLFAGTLRDCLQGDTCQKLPTMSENEFYNMDISSKKKKKNIMMLYCTTNGTNQLDHIDEQNLLKKKKKTKMSSLLKPHSHSESSSEKRRRKFWHRESMYPIEKKYILKSVNLIHFVHECHLTQPNLHH